MSGCVTSTDSRFQREADREEAIENYVRLATAYIGQGNVDRARVHLDRATELAPDAASVLAAKGLLYQVDSEDELAERAYRSAISNDEGYTRARVYYGAFLYGKGRFEEARDQFAAASRDTEYQDRASVFFNLGLSEERLEDTDAAVRAYRRSVELSRGDVKSLLALSRTLVANGDFAAAEGYYARLMGIMQRNSNLRHSPESLITGIRIARYFGDSDREASLALLLKSDFPSSLEYQQYKVLNADGQ
ncbi:tetratricopeptide repeat protein [Marinobacter confluentis]|uniref:Tetratricopeptide repeat protein n=1 Tax=Marinobacter confluentis TaxID=1697557 RepID=A0A4Z1C450_9GAMM|nr:tetratricopeptide repeat protein [Marinobacter confluentis]TGN42048.1 tetratricopeptide repeat protein [Marinobacter confluentis]